MEHPRVVFSRKLPGGGVVAVEERWSGTETAAIVAVERRADPHRRLGHTPPVIAEANGQDAAALSRYLIGIACDNVSVAAGLLRASGRITPRM
ncbi:MAG: hypothetical protein ACT4OZ_06790 [Gemmatimonadota bacterium]